MRLSEKELQMNKNFCMAEKRLKAGSIEKNKYIG